MGFNGNGDALAFAVCRGLLNALDQQVQFAIPIFRPAAGGRVDSWRSVCCSPVECQVHCLLETIQVGGMAGAVLVHEADVAGNGGQL